MHLTPPTLTAVLLSTLALVSHLAPTAEAHSWADCIDWRFKNPSREAWGASDGECKGFARRFPQGSEFGALDHANPSRHYQQKLENKNDSDSALPCSDHKHGKDVGSDETMGNPVESAYGGKYGPMTHTRVGDTLCVRWPAKNHAEDNEDDDMMVLINLAQREGKDPSQKELTKNKVAELPYKNCGKGKNPDRRPCGGCFKVPMRASGTYLLQWRWMLNEGEWYTSCADIQIGDSDSSSRRRK
ncbi:hypothetical protein BGZ88_012302 [Linnemannia elongata]|nr:hypothetical protein BGZ88_012302 [Linnemannia elongata]